MNIVPEPVVVRQVCSLCGEEWTAHGNTPTTLDCIRLLKAKAAPVVVNPIFPVYPQPSWQPNWYNPPQIWCGSLTSATTKAYTVNATSTLTRLVMQSPEEGEPPEPVAA